MQIINCTDNENAKKFSCTNMTPTIQYFNPLEKVKEKSVDTHSWLSARYVWETGRSYFYRWLIKITKPNK